MTTCNYTYIGKGKVYLEPRDPKGPARFLGNVSSLSISSSITENKVPDSTQGGGGSCSTHQFVDTSTAAMDLWNLSPENFTLAAGGKGTDNAVETIADEPHKAYVGGLITFSKIYDKATDPIVAKGATNLAVGTDYDLTDTGIIPKAGGAIADGDDITVSYTSVLSTTIQALTDIGKEFRMIFEGLNDAQNQKRVRVILHRFQPSPSESINLITDEFNPVNISGENLRDSDIVGVGESQFYKMDQEHV